MKTISNIFQHAGFISGGHMGKLILFLCCISFSSTSLGCSCWKRYLGPDHPEHPKNSIYFQFEVVSGDSISPIERPSPKDESIKSTIIEVVDPLTSQRSVGDQIEINQDYGSCMHSFVKNRKYILYYDNNQQTQDIGYCHVGITGKVR